MARQRPRDHAALAEIPGVGRSKLERYGDIFLEVVAHGARA
jgi:ATP-dependent DNA helicase RecQ